MIRFFITNSCAVKLALFVFAFFALGNLIGQEQWVPKIGINIPATPMQIDGQQLDAKSGLSLGINYRLGGPKVFFNPGLFYIRNSLSISNVEGTSISEPIQETGYSYFKIFLCGSAQFVQIGANSNIHLRTGFVPSFRTGTPDFTNTDIADDVMRSSNLEYLFGLGMDISSLTVDLDYNLSLLKGFRGSDIVQNAYTISVGYKL